MTRESRGGTVNHAGGRGSVRAGVARCMHGGADGAAPSRMGGCLHGGDDGAAPSRMGGCLHGGDDGASPPSTGSVHGEGGGGNGSTTVFTASFGARAWLEVRPPGQRTSTVAPGAVGRGTHTEAASWLP